MPEFPLRHLPPHLFPDAERRPHLVQIILRGVVHHVRKGHVGIQEHQRLLLGKGGTDIIHERRKRPAVRRFPGVVIPLYLFAVRSIREKMHFPDAGAARQHRENQSRHGGLENRLL